MRPTNLGALALVATIVGIATPLAAQIDYRNLDDDRPVVTEDAYPVEYRAFEFLAPYTFEQEPGGGTLHALVPEVEYGILRNGQIGLKAAFAGAGQGGSTDWGMAGLRPFGLYNFNTESRHLPAFSVRVDLHLPVGSLGGDQSRVTLKGMATRSWGRTRFHGNAAWTFGSVAGAAVVEPGARWSYSLAADRTLFRQSTLLVGEVATVRSAAGTPIQVNAGVGVRYQWSPTTVVDIGVRRRLRMDTGPDLAVTMALSHAFALPGLMPRAARR